MDESIERAIISAIERREPDATDIAVTDASPHASLPGAFTLTLAWKTDGELHLGSFVARSIDPSSAEPRLLPVIATTSIPVPQVLGAGIDPTSEQSVIVTSVPDGEPLTSLLAAAGMRWEISAMAFTWARALARIHSLDWREVTPWMADVEGVPEDIIDDQVEVEMSRWRDQAASLAPPVRARAEQALDWLELRRPVEVSLCLCHGGFNLDSVYIAADEVSAITMWDGARVTDASYDLATLRSDLDSTGMGEDEADLFAQAAYGAYLQASPRGLANTPYYSVARPLAAILDGLAAGDESETEIDRHWSIIERAMRNAARVPWRA